MHGGTTMEWNWLMAKDLRPKKDAGGFGGC